MTFECIIVGGLETNCYVLRSNTTGIIIDPGAEAGKIIKSAAPLSITLILVTHRHSDHTAALDEVKKTTGAQTAIHALDWSSSFDQKLADNQIIPFGPEKIMVLHTPGHTQGGCCFLINTILFSGDTLFPNGPGNTSYSGGDEKAIYHSIRTKLMVLPDETEVYPGHGPATTIGRERGLY